MPLKNYQLSIINQTPIFQLSIIVFSFGRSTDF